METSGPDTDPALNLGFVTHAHVWTVAAWFLREECDNHRTPVQCISYHPPFVESIVIPRRLVRTPNFVIWRRALLNFGVRPRGTLTRKGNVRLVALPTKPVSVDPRRRDAAKVCEVLAEWVIAFEQLAGEFGPDFERHLHAYQLACWKRTDTPELPQGVAIG